MNRDLIAINEEIDELMQKPPSRQKYDLLSSLYICKDNIEKSLKTSKGTVITMLEDKINSIGAPSTLKKLEPILSDFIKDLEQICPTMSGEFIKRLKEM